MNIIQHENQWPWPCEQLEELTNRAMAAIALVLGCDLSAAGERPERRKDVRELRSDLVVECSEPLRVQAAEVFIERIDEDGERQVVLEFRRRPAKNEMPTDLGAFNELSKKTSLADPRFARHLDRAGVASIELIEEPLERFELVGTSDQVLAHQGHAALSGPTRASAAGSKVLPTAGPSGG